MTTAEAKALIRPCFLINDIITLFVWQRKRSAWRCDSAQMRKKRSSPGFCMTSRKRFPRRNNCK